MSTRRILTAALATIAVAAPAATAAAQPADMHASLQKLAALPDDTAVYCGHEYTLGNARFAHSVEPANAAISDRLRAVETMRAAGEATVPTTIAAERATNPFLRAADADELGRLRAAKDRFAG